MITKCSQRFVVINKWIITSLLNDWYENKCTFMFEALDTEMLKTCTNKIYQFRITHSIHTVMWYHIIREACSVDRCGLYPYPLVTDSWGHPSAGCARVAKGILRNFIINEKWKGLRYLSIGRLDFVRSLELFVLVDI